ncbi:MAG: endo-1,4-beta-xylanase, partial [Bacteroidota bacterium]
MKHSSLIWLVSFWFLLACQTEPLEVCNLQPEPLHATAAYPIGFAANPSLLTNDAAYRALANIQFNSLTPENHFKPAYLQPNPGEFDWKTADQLILYAAQQGKRVHGHTLLWHNQSPAWMETYTGSKEQWDSLLKIHVQTVVGHFQGKVSGWDVVNEAVDD